MKWVLSYNCRAFDRNEMFFFSRFYFSANWPLVAGEYIFVAEHNTHLILYNTLHTIRTWWANIILGFLPIKKTSILLQKDALFDLFFAIIIYIFPISFELTKAGLNRFFF